MTITAAVSGGTQTAITDASGQFALSNVPSGAVVLTGTHPGFANARRSFVFDQRPRQADFVMQVGGAFRRP